MNDTSKLVINLLPNVNSGMMIASDSSLSLSSSCYLVIVIILGVAYDCAIVYVSDTMYDADELFTFFFFFFYTTDTFTSSNSIPCVFRFVSVCIRR